MSRSVFEGKLNKAYKTIVKHTILDLGHALLTHHEAPSMHTPHKCHLEASWAPSTSHDSTASPRPSTWPGGMREAA